MTSTILKDSEILEKIRHEDSHRYGFHLLVKKYQERLYLTIRRMVVDHELANDILQEVFIIIWQKIDHFRGDASLFTWIYRITVNECLRQLKKNKSKISVSLESVTNLNLSTSATPDGEEVIHKLQKAVKSLPEKQQAIFNLKYYDDLSYEEISGIMGTSIGGLKANYHHAVKKIEKYLNGD